MPLVGGLAAGGGEPDTQALFLDGEVLYEGAVGAVLRGVPVRTVVSQGCEPVGRDSVITNAEDNVVFELAGEPALERLKGDLGTLTPEQERSAARGGVLAGLVIDENRAEYRRGDYLMRGLDRRRRGDGRARDRRGGARRPDAALPRPRRGVGRRGPAREPRGRARRRAGRGRAALHLQRARHEPLRRRPTTTRAPAAELLGGDSLAGFFCAGEIGPVGGKPFLHGFTATLPRSSSRARRSRPRRGCRARRAPRPSAPRARARTRSGAAARSRARPPARSRSATISVSAQKTAPSANSATNEPCGANCGSRLVKKTAIFGLPRLLSSPCTSGGVRSARLRRRRTPHA